MNDVAIISETIGSGSCRKATASTCWASPPRRIVAIWATARSSTSSMNSGATAWTCWSATRRPRPTRRCTSTACAGCHGTNWRGPASGRGVTMRTGVRGYASVAEVLDALESYGSELRCCSLKRLFFPLAHPLVRWWNVRWPVTEMQGLYRRRPWRGFERLALPIPRYREIELVLRRRDEPRLAATTGTRA